MKTKKHRLSTTLDDEYIIGDCECGWSDVGLTADFVSHLFYEHAIDSLKQENYELQNKLDKALGVDPPKWDREDVQRVLYHVVKNYEQAQFMGGDSELLRAAIYIAKLTLQDNDWWSE